MKINVGCGDKRLPGYTGVDVSPASGADIIATAQSIPLPDGCADEVLAIHLVEHIYAWEVPGTLAEWARLLKPGGLLVIEAPDIWKACRNVVEHRQGKHPEQLGMWGIFGDARSKNPLMLHRWGWTFLSLSPLVQAAGFNRLIEKETVFHAIGRGVRDFRLEARRA